MMHDNPCLQCGACCAAFRVSFFNGEADPNLGGVVPESLTEDLTPHICCMKGTNQSKPYCIALAGKVGVEVRCAIYERRSSTCRGFGFHPTDGMFVADLDEVRRCNKARKACNLPPLKVKNLAAL
ncbi:MAG TPA: YkgJ family cysteine cluster protein [Bacteroidota bacterium]|nr:YkgJ family cysteine cluster protein [Bacteroidota bacterium]